MRIVRDPEPKVYNRFFDRNIYSEIIEVSLTEKNIYAIIDHENFDDRTSLLALNIDNLEEETKIDIGTESLFSLYLANNQYLLMGAEHCKIIVVDTKTNKMIGTFKFTDIDENSQSKYFEPCPSFNDIHTLKSLKVTQNCFAIPHDNIIDII